MADTKKITAGDVQKKLRESKLNLIFNPMKYDELLEIKKHLDKTIESKKSEKIAALEAELELLKPKSQSEKKS